MLKYNDQDLGMEERFDDLDCASYEIADYNAEDLALPGWTEEDREASVKSSYKKQKKAPEDCENLYTRTVKIEGEEASKKRFIRLRNSVLYGTKEERDAANEEACLYLKGLVIQCINQRYLNYIQKDPDYRNELMNEAFFNIIKYLPKYDPDKGQPSTFFYFYIQSALATVTTRVKHHTSSSDSALKRKIIALRRKFKEFGQQPSAADISLQTGESMSKVQSVMRIMDYDTNTHLEAFEQYDQFIPGNPEYNQSYESPERLAIQHTIVEEILKRGRELFDDATFNIYLRNMVDNEAIRDIAQSLGVNDDKIRRTIESVQHGMEHDWKVRRLGAGYIRDNDDEDPYALPIVSLKGQCENMELLDMAMFQ